MRKNIKVALSVVLVTAFIFVCFIVIAATYFGSWLNTYNAFTAKTLVAKFSLSELKEDADGKYIDLEYQPLQQASALVYLFNPQVQPVSGTVEKYKLYGDSVHIGGPIVKLHNSLILFNFDSVYKVSTIYSRYNLDNEAERNRKYPTTFSINGGIDYVWQAISDTENSWPYSMFVDTTFISTPAPIPPSAGQNQKREYNLYVTDEGFIPERID